MLKRSRKKTPKENSEIEKEKFDVSEKLKDYLVRAHSFQEVGTEVLPEEEYDVLKFPQLLFAAGVIISMYGYFIVYVSRDSFSAFFDGFIVLIAGNIIATLGMIKLLKKYWGSFFMLLIISTAIIIIMMALWDFVIKPWAFSVGIIIEGDSIGGSFLQRFAIVLLTTTTFAYTSCFVWYLLARYTSVFYFKIFSRGGKKARRFFIVDPWRKTLSSKVSLIGDILGRIYYPFFFLLAVILTLSEYGDLYFIQIDWDNYFQTVLLMYGLLCLMVVLFPAFWLLDYVRFYNESRLEVRSIGRQVLILVKGYAGFGTIFSFISRSQVNFFGAILELFNLALYLIPSLIILIGGYVLLTERDVYYIADKLVHGDKVIVDYRLIDSTGSELKWWVKSTKQNIGGSNDE